MFGVFRSFDTRYYKYTTMYLLLLCTHVALFEFRNGRCVGIMEKSSFWKFFVITLCRIGNVIFLLAKND